MKISPQLEPSHRDSEFSNGYDLLFATLKKKNILWCSWKSNEHLMEGIEGKTDTDLLFYERDRQQVTKILHDCGFILFQAPAHRSYPGIIDALSIDPPNGRILHAHSHFLLDAGEKYLKSYMLPWSDFILETRVTSELSSRFFTSAPQVETVLLLVRESLKIRWRDRLRSKPEKSWGNTEFQKELIWLKERATPANIKDCAKVLLNEEAAELIHEMVTKNVSLGNFMQLRAMVKQISTQRSWQRMGKVTALGRRWLNEGLWLATRIAEKTGISQKAIIRRRVLPGKGLVVAVLGIDGSGKSTVTRTIVSQWEAKLDIAYTYFGTGDGPQTLWSMMLKPVLFAGRTAKKLLKKFNITRNMGNSEVSDNNRKISLSVILYAVTGALNKKRQIHRVNKLRNRGFVVICDRWPQNQTSGMNDAPFLSNFKDHGNFIYRYLARWEARQFKSICSLQQPDIVIRLFPSLEVAINRKEENKEMAEMIGQKLDALRVLRFPDTVDDHTVDANQPLETVLENVRRIIWHHLQRRPVAPPDGYECVGLPGAGKSTICQRIFEERNLKSVDDIFSPAKPASIFKKVGLTIGSIISDPVIYFFIIKFSCELRLWSHGEALNYLFRLPVQKLRLKNTLQDQPHLLEQLLLQNIWSALVSAQIDSVRPDCLAPLIARLYHNINTTIFYFDISPEEAARRIHRRKNGTSRFDGLAEEKISNGMKTLSNLMKNIMTSASYAGLNIVYIDAAKSIDEILAGTIMPLIKDSK